MTVYALLVGIDEYASPRVNPLRGCVKDIERFRDFLRARVIPDDSQPTRDDAGEPADADGRLHVKMLRNSEATRQNIIDGFAHLRQAGPEDVALFYYSGHGSQEPAPRKFWAIEPDRLNETLVCHDSRSAPDKGWDLADKELALLLSQVAERQPHLLVILDACHSGSGTRDAEVEGVRLTPADNRTRPLETYLPGSADIQPNGDEPGGWFSLPAGSHILLAACRPEEVAREAHFEDEQRGVFSHFLLEALQRLGPTPTYRDLFKQVHARVRSAVATQSPQLETTKDINTNQPFLGDGVVVARRPYFTLAHHPAEGWRIDGGAVHGLPAVTRPETTLLALFPPDANLDHLENLSGALGEAAITEVYPSDSRVQVTLTGDTALDTSLTYKAVVTALPLPPVVVSLAGDPAGLVRLRAQLNNADNEASLLVIEGDAETAALHLTAGESGFRIRRAGEAYPLAVDIAGLDDDSARQAVQRLAHIARWLKTAQLSNPASRLLPQDFEIQAYELVEKNGQTVEQPLSERVNYQLKADGTWAEPRLCFKFINHGSRPLYLAMLNLTDTYEIYAGLIPDGNHALKLNPGETGVSNNGDPVYMVVPKALWQQGLVEMNDLFKFIISTDEFDAMLLAQDELDTTFVALETKGISRLNTLNRLMERVQTRAARRKPETDEAFSDWRTVDLSVTTIRPQQAAEISRDAPAQLGSNVEIAPHPGLQATARLLTTPQASRNLGSLSLPPWLRKAPDLCQPFEFSTTRSAGRPGLSVLELELPDAAGYTAVTRAEPLKIHVSVPVAAHEQVLPVGFDGEFFLPLGRVTARNGGTEITLERLPRPGGSRSLANSLRIYFQKVAGKIIGTGYDFPSIAVVSYDDQSEQIFYQTDPATVAHKIAAANRIVMFVHGIIGETQNHTPSAWQPVDGRRLADDYLILACDYENLETGIEATAIAIADKLKALGLGPDKKLTIVAHSMGGLVARWLIEHVEGGREMAAQLIMLGTPNAGSPWPTVQDWVFTLLTFGLNNFATWPVQAIAGLLTGAERLDKMLDQMKGDSNLLQTLAHGRDPGVPYTVIAGNTSLRAEVLEPGPTDPDRRSLAERLLGRLYPDEETLHKISDLLFRQPNDVAVAVDSVKHVPDQRTPPPRKLEVACDHFGYFTTETGRRALVEAVIQFDS